MNKYEMYNVNTRETEIISGESLDEVRQKNPKYEEIGWTCLYVEYGEEYLRRCEE